MNWSFDDHGRLRASMRSVPGVLIDIVFRTGQDVGFGKTEGTSIREGRVNGGVLGVLYWPGDPAVVHSVWWVNP